MKSRKITVGKDWFKKKTYEVEKKVRKQKG